MKKVVLRYLASLLILLYLGPLGGCASNSGSDSTEPNPNPTPGPEPSIDLVINNISSDCLPSGNTALEIFVSAIDENGGLVNDLSLSNFQISINSAGIPSQEIDFSLVQDVLPEPVSVAILMDYSTSITEDPQTQTAMENAVIGFIDLMMPDDQAEILKFNNGIRTIQPFTSDKAVLREAATDMEGVDPGSTYLFDSLYHSIEDAAAQIGRKAVVAITDGEELHEPNRPGEGYTMQAVIALARNNRVPLFLIGLSSEVDEEVLQQMADQTGGHFYQAASSAELRDIYSNVSNLLNEGQYRMALEVVPTAQPNGNLSVAVSYNGLNDNVGSTFPYAVCP